MTTEKREKKSFKRKFDHAVRDFKTIMWYMLATIIVAAMLGAYCGIGAYRAYAAEAHIYHVILLSITGAGMFFGLPTIMFTWSRSEE